MQHTLCSKVGSLLLVALLGAALVVPVFAAEQAQELKTLKLVNTYQSEADVRVAYPYQFPNIEKIIQTDDSIQLATPQKKQLKTFETESLTEQERQHVRTSPDTNPVFKNGISRHLSNDWTLLLEADVIVKMREPGYRYEGDVETKKLTLYNARGDIITELPREVTMIEVSPTRQYFVAYTYNVYEKLSDLLYFYTMQGRLLQTQKIIETPQITYSQNGEFVQVFSNMEHPFAIFTKTGDIVYQGDYTALLKDIHPTLFGVFISERGEYMLLALGQQIHLYTIQGNFLWMNSFPGFDVAGCWFFTSHEKIALKTVTSRRGDDRYNLQIHSLKTGEMLEQIVGIADMTGHKDHLIVKKGGEYYDYQMQ